MGRNIEFGKDEWREYTPETFNNRVDPDPITMEIHWISGSEYRKYRKGLVVKQQHGDIKMNTEEINRNMLANNVRSIQNYSINGKAITSGDELALHGEGELLDEILDVLVNISRLEEGSKNALSSHSDSR